MYIHRLLSRIRNAFYNIENIEKIINKQLTITRYNELSMVSSERGTSEKFVINRPIVISLTTYGLRINEVHLTIESLLHQTVKPNKIILWLDNSFKDTAIPYLLRMQEKRGLEICYCIDIRSYTKLVPTIESCPNSVIITVDDDMIYTPDFIEHLVNAYKKDSTKVYFYRGHKIAFDKNGKIAPYDTWVTNGAKGSSIFNLPTGVSGVLYPPNCFHVDVTNRNIFLKICPYADDIWFKAMTLINEIECEKIETGKEADEKFIYIETAVSYSLSNINNLQKMNDVQIDQVFKKYDLKSILVGNTFKNT